jgi:predicted GNAT family acetyltransferase
VPGVLSRPASAGDLDLVTRWRVAYCVEILGAADGEALRAESREDMRRMCDARSAWLVEHDGIPMSFSGFNARLPDVVQIGGVFTPPAFRSHGWARAAVAGQLAAAVEEGVARAILFTRRGQSRGAARVPGDRLPADRRLRAAPLLTSGHAATT